MNTWGEFAREDPELAGKGQKLLFPFPIGRCFLATIRKDGAPRLHPVSLVFYQEGLYVLIPSGSPKCSDLLRDGRFALQSFPTSWEAGEEFYISGMANQVKDHAFLRSMVVDTGISVQKDEILFELRCERVMHTCLEDAGTISEHPVHKVWRSSNRQQSKNLATK